ncbi:MAG: hypothetical protein NTY04_02550 [Candidatus Staskawiczbacteria bacterium]|nr:hypothetical protein [Candidatus Staskawiczbacteria bacterium]
MIPRPKMPWKQKDFRVIIIDRDNSTRQRLTKHYREQLAKSYARSARSVVVKLKNIGDAIEKIRGGFKPHLVIFSVSFPESGRGELRTFLNSNVDRHIPEPVTFVMVTLAPQGTRVNEFLGR